MKTRGLDLELPDCSIAAETVVIEGRPVRRFEPGDFLLGRAHGFNHRILKFGQRLRIRGADRSYAGYTHAALITSDTGDLVEAVGEGVRRSTLAKYVTDKEVFQVVRIVASPEDRRQIVDFAEFVLRQKAPYGFLSNISTAFWAFTGSRLVFFLDGSYTCSGLVAAALERTSALFDMSATRVMPAQLAIFFGAPPPPG